MEKEVGKWEESQDAGRVRHREHPQSKAGHKTQGFCFPFRQNTHTLLLLRGARNQPFNGEKQPQRGRMVVTDVWFDAFPTSLSPCRSLSLSLSSTYTRQHVRADAIQEGGSKRGRSRLSVSEDRNDEQRKCQIRSLSTSHTLLATEGCRHFSNVTNNITHKELQKTSSFIPLV